MVGSPFNKENIHEDMVERTISDTLYNHIDYSYAKYVGGHPLYQKGSDTGVYFYNDRIEVINPRLIIPYSSITRIENMDENKIDRERVTLGLLFFTPLAIHALVKKKKHTYTVIQYDDVHENEQNGGIRNLGSTHIPDLINYRQASDRITVVLDFKEDINRIQSLMHDKVIESKQNDIK